MYKYFKFGFLLAFLIIIITLIFSYNYTISQFEQSLAGSTQSIVFYSKDDKPFYTMSSDFNKTYIPITKIKRELLISVIAIEDTRFFQHLGFDVPRLTKVFIYWLTHKNLTFGASTITQQLVKNVLLSPERTIKRKILELFAAFFLEIKYSKKEILEFYLNNIFFGKNSYGIEAASQNYFSKSASELNLAESALLAALIKKPEGYSPLNKIEIARQRQILVLKRLLQLGWINQQDYITAAQQKVLVFSDTQYQKLAPYFVSAIINELSKKYSDKILYKEGLRVYTTLDWHSQNTMERVVQTHLKNFDQSQQIAGILIENQTGKVRALVGGRSFSDSQFNRALQAYRQPGSAIKPFIYSLALENGWLPNQTIIDEPTYYVNSETDKYTTNFDNYYEPKNFDLTNQGEVTLAYALITSNNVVSVSLLNKLGLSKYADFANKAQLDADPIKGLCLALGCNTVSLANLTNAYSSFANQGKLCKPIFYHKLTTAKGEILEESTDDQINCQQFMSQDTAYIMKHLLNGVIKKGTAKNADINRFAGGKTGTSDDFRDAWFVGFTNTYTAGFWMGKDDNSQMDGETGGRTPAKIWRDYMLAIPEINYQDNSEYESQWETLKICGITGYLATPYSPFPIDIKFKPENAPTDFCPEHTQPYTEYE